ncbi:MAG: AAA family ATPase [Elusimicrobia bacterium]|nr:AAA family ATPase [Elusimicrobiota bacterium]
MRSDHFEHLAELLEIERRAEREENKKELERYPIETREALGKTATKLTLVGEDIGAGGYPLLILNKHLKEGILSPFQAMGAGDNVLVTLPDSGTIEGTLYKVEDASVTVALNKPPPQKMASGPFRIDLLGSDATYHRMTRALEEVKNAKLGLSAGVAGSAALLRDIFMGKKKPRIGKPAKVTFMDRGLNEIQRHAVQVALAAPEIALIHGPPGTGKTTVLVEVIRQAINKKISVLASAPSNIAVDNILEKLLGFGVRAVRLGHPARISESLRHATLDVLIAEDPMQEEIQKLHREREKASKGKGGGRNIGLIWKEIHAAEKSIAKSVLESAQVILATHAGLGKAVANKNFDLVVLDEASQATEPLSWIPLCKAKKAVLAGDTRQLPPTLYSIEAAKEGLAVTLLDRLEDLLPKGLQTQLRVQYRMHKKIMEFPSQELYKGSLIADDTVKSHLLSDLSRVKSHELTTHPFLYVDTAGAGFEETWNQMLDSRENRGEADLALYFFRELRRLGVSPTQIGILTPYVAQVRLLKSLGKEPGLEIGSIDGFQGREKEAVILSLVRSNDKGEVGFLSDIRRMNVAMTRARRFLIVIGDSATISRHPFYIRFLEYADKISSHRSAYEYNLDT